MRILDEQNQELNPEDIDLSLGYLKNEKLFIRHVPAQTHCKVDCFVFDDSSIYRPINENDPHVRVIDAAKGQFDYIPDEDETRKLKGAAIGLVIDKEAEDIYEDIKRYILFRVDELELRELPSRMDTAEDSITETQEELEEANLNIEDLILLMAEILGGDEEEEEELEEESEEEEEIPEIEPEEEPSEQEEESEKIPEESSESEEPIEEELIEEEPSIEDNEEPIV